MRRRAARRELTDCRQQAEEIGRWLQIVVTHLRQPRPCQVANENGTLIFRTPTPPHMFLYQEAAGDPPATPHPSAEVLAQLLNQITSLETEIAALTTCIGE